MRQPREMRRAARPPFGDFLSAIQTGSFLTLHYRLAGPDGTDLVNTFAGTPATLSLGNGELPPALEQRLMGLEPGTRRSFELSAGEAFGAHNPALRQRVARSLLREHGDPDAVYEVGDVVRFPAPDGSHQFAGVVVEVGGDWLLFDFNHPLAGQPVSFEVDVIGVL